MDWTNFFVSWSQWAAIGLLKILGCLIGAGLFGVWWCQDKFLYLAHLDNRKGEQRQIHHNRQGFKSPSEYNLTWEDCYITTKDHVTVHTWLLLQENKSVCPTIIFFHGNAGNIGFRLPNARSMYWFARANILMVDYRGYGNSQGHPTERGLILDAQACLDFLLARQDLNHRKIFVFGQSLGGAVAITLASNNLNSICGVIVENTFTSVDDMVIVMAERFKIKRGILFLRCFLYFFLTNHWPNKQLVKDLTCPILFISGLADELIPPSQMKELYDLATASRSRQFYPVLDGEHNNTYIKGAESYFETMSNFISNHQ